MITMNKDIKKKINILIKEISHKKEDALEELYNLTYKIIFSFLKRYTNNIEIIKDTISMTFITIIEKATSRLFYINCFSWMLTISKNHLFNNLRKFNQSYYIDETKEFDNLTYEVSDKSLDVKLAINNLSIIDKQILYLKYHQDLNINSIAKILSLSPSTIKRKLKTIYNKLQEDLNDGK